MDAPCRNDLPTPRRLGCPWLMTLMATLLLFVSSGPVSAQSLQEQIDATPHTDWPERLTGDIERINAAYPGEIGVFVRDLEDDSRFSFHGEQRWYLASMVKVPVALALMDDVDAGRLSLDDTMTLERSDYVDGAGETNWHSPGEQLSLRWLLEQMITRSDNTATDMLIRRVGGADRVNEHLKTLVPEGFERITTLADVRRYAYSEFHPNAMQLDGLEFVDIRKAREEKARLAAISRFIGVPVSDFRARDLSEAFENYYAAGLNSGRLDAYGQLLTRLVRGELLSQESTDELMAVMARTRTGAKRLRADWPDTVSFAHKTGTQRGRFCDGGVAIHEGETGAQRVAIVACTQGSLSLARSEQALKEVGQAIRQSGVFR
ncbi:serine hydrolase [Kushneria pakistanensis]|nr:serine hydrolase [Kushneria pakistanensis]